MATFSKDSNTTHVSAVKMEMPPLLEIVRAEAQRLPQDHCGLNLLLTHFWDFDDFKSGKIPFIRRPQGESQQVSFSDLQLAHGKTIPEIRTIFNRHYTRTSRLNGGADPTPTALDTAWRNFMGGHGTLEIPPRLGGKCTYQQLLDAGKLDSEIRQIFNSCARKHDNMKVDSYRHKMRSELLKMIAAFDPHLYANNTRCTPLSPHLEKHSASTPPPTPTTFCEAVARMMTLVRCSHLERGADARAQQAVKIKAQQKIAAVKRTTKYNQQAAKLGNAAWNKKKAREQAAKAQRDAEKVKLPAAAGDNAKFVKWRTTTPAGKKFDTCPQTALVTRVSAAPVHTTQTIHLGYTNHSNHAAVLRHLLDKSAQFSNFRIKFQPDPTMPESQLYKYAPLADQRPAMLRKTTDLDASRTFTIHGLVKWARPSAYTETEYYIQLDDKFKRPLGGQVYYSLPPKWKHYERWAGFGIMGNPQLSTYMPTLVKVVPTNIAELTFVHEKTEYKLGYTSNKPLDFHTIIKGIRTPSTPAEKAALFAKEVKRKRAQEARQRETARRAFRVSRPPPNLGENPFLGADTTDAAFNMFFGVGGAQQTPHSATKAKLATKLSRGEIDAQTFNAAMAALD